LTRIAHQGHRQEYEDRDLNFFHVNFPPSIVFILFSYSCPLEYLRGGAAVDRLHDEGKFLARALDFQFSFSGILSAPTHESRRQFFFLMLERAMAKFCGFSFIRDFPYGRSTPSDPSLLDWILLLMGNIFKDSIAG
jgi:hypothetical protein